MNSINTLKALSVVTNVDTGFMLKRLQKENQDLEKEKEELQKQNYNLISQLQAADEFEDYLWLQNYKKDAFIAVMNVELDWELFSDNWPDLIEDTSSEISGDDSTEEYELVLIEP